MPKRNSSKARPKPYCPRERPNQRTMKRLQKAALKALALRLADEQQMAHDSAVLAKKDDTDVLLREWNQMAVDISIFTGQIRAVLYAAVGPRTKDTTDAKRRLTPFPFSLLLQGELDDLIDEPPIITESSSRIVGTARATNFDKIAKFVNADDKSSKSLGAARARRDGSVSVAVAIDLRFTWNKQPNAFGVLTQFLDIEVTRAHVNTKGVVHLNQVKVAPADRELVDRFVRTMPFRFESAGKEYSEELLDICAELAAMAREEGFAAGANAGVGSAAALEGGAAAAAPPSRL
jgi:hypothetical protein